MTFVLDDRVRETTSDTGTGPFAVGGAVSGYKSFGSRMSVSDQTFCAMFGGTEWQTGLVTYSASNQVTFTEVWESSNADNAVSFSAGTKDIICDLPAFSKMSANGKALLRSILGIAPTAAMAASNIALNAAVDISQQFGTADTLLTNNTALCIADQWYAMYKNTAAVCLGGQQVPGAAFLGTLAGFQFAAQLRASTALSSLASGDFAKLFQLIEGYRVAHLGWGATGALPISVATMVYASGSGVWLAKLSNADQSRCYYHEFSVVSGWNFVPFTAPGDTTGTWNATNGIGLTVEIFGAGKETTPVSSLDAWGTTNKVQSTNSINGLPGSSNVIGATGLYINVGTQLPTMADLPALMRPFPLELWECERYYWKSFPHGTLPGNLAGTSGAITASSIGSTSFGTLMTAQFPRRMRTGPSIITYNPSANNSSVRNTATSTDVATTNVSLVGDRGVSINAGGTNSDPIAYGLAVHATANARLL